MVGQLPLEQHIGVRIPGGQPKTHFLALPRTALVNPQHVYKISRLSSIIASAAVRRGAPEAAPETGVRIGVHMLHVKWGTHKSHLWRLGDDMPLKDTAVRTLKPTRQGLYKYTDRRWAVVCWSILPAAQNFGAGAIVSIGKEKLMALGEYPVVSLARRLVTGNFPARKTLASGVDPMAERKAEAEARQKEAEAREREAESSFEKVARKWWGWWAVGKSQRHANYVLRRLEADVFPSFGGKFIEAVTAADIRNLMLTIEDRGARDVAKRAHETTGQVFRYAIAHGDSRAEILRPISSLKIF